MPDEADKVGRTHTAPNGVTIRPATPADAADICELLQEIDKFHQPFDRVQIRQGDPQPMDQAKVESTIASDVHRVHVAECKGRVIAYVRVSIEKTKGNRIFRPLKVVTVHDLIVAHDSRNQGIGTALMQCVEGTVKETGAHRIRLEYYAENDTACRFYEALGFRQLRHTVVHDTPANAGADHHDT